MRKLAFFKGAVGTAICLLIVTAFSKAIRTLHRLQKQQLYNDLVLKFIKLEKSLSAEISDDPRLVKEIFRYRAELLAKILCLERDPNIASKRLPGEKYRYSEKSLYQIQSAVEVDIEKVNARLADEYLSACELFDVRQNIAVLIAENKSIFQILEKKYLDNLIMAFDDYGLVLELVPSDAYGNLREDD